MLTVPSGGEEEVRAVDETPWLRAVLERNK